jgi:CHASE2 domain-containing sensor protein
MLGCDALAANFTFHLNALLTLLRSSRLRAALKTTFWPCAALLALQALGVFQDSGLRVFDLLNALSATREPPKDVVVVAYDAEDVSRYSLAGLQQDATTEKVLRRVLAANAAVIGLHVYTDTAREPGSASLQELILRTANVVALDGRAIPSLRLPEVHAPNPTLLAQGRTGTAVITVDSDRIVRRTKFSWPDRAGDRSGPPKLVQAPTLAVLLVQKYLGSANPLQVDNAGGLRVGGKTYQPVGDWQGDYRGPNSAGAKSTLLATRSFQDADAISYSEVLDPNTDLSRLAGKVVLIGALNQDGENTFQLPFQWRFFSGVNEISYRVDITAHQVDNLIAVARDGWPVFRAWPFWLGALWSVAWAVLCAYFMVPTRGLREWLVVAGTLSIGIVISAIVAFHFGLAIPVVTPLLGIFVITLMTMSYVFRAEGALRDFVEVTRRVLNQLPEPIFVRDSLGNIRLVNESFCRLADALPEQLLGKSLRDVLPNWRSTKLEPSLSPIFQTGGMINQGSALKEPPIGQNKNISDEHFVDTVGRAYTLQMLSASLSRPGRQDLVVGLVRSFSAVGSDHGKPCGDSALLRSYTHCNYWAQKHGQETLAQLLEVEDYALLCEAYTAAAAAALLPQICERIRRAMPEAYHVALDIRDGYFWVFRAIHVGDHAYAQSQTALTQAFGYNFIIGGESVELKARCVSASAPLDGQSFAQLQSHLWRQLELDDTLPASSGPGAPPIS